ncbi:MAG: NADPH-dependent reductase [Candidatus Saccharibacteria bacterium]|nr:NADPH-dependent reductase [Candidatus Saccharibacteria bacterium]
MKVQIIVGATRQGRVSDRLAPWIIKQAKETLPSAEFEVVDMVDYPLPFFDEAISPQYNPDRQPTPEVAKFLSKIAEGDAYIVVTPEYNRTYPAVLKNAFDTLDFQMKQKPVALVAHGSTGGAQSVAHFRSLIPAVQAISTPHAVYFAAQPGTAIDDEGNLAPELAANPYGPQTALQQLLADLNWYAEALSAARTNA